MLCIVARIRIGIRNILFKSHIKIHKNRSVVISIFIVLPGIEVCIRSRLSV